MIHAPPDHPRATQRILSCDEATVSGLLQRFLGFNGFEVVGLERAEVLLETLGAERFDLLILDPMLPGLGLKILSQIREVPGCADLPILVLTVKRLGQAERAHVRRAGATVIRKPFHVHELIQRVRQAVSQ